MDLTKFYTRRRNGLHAWYESMIDGQSFPFDEGNEAEALDNVRRHVAGIVDAQDAESGPRPELSLSTRRDIYGRGN